MSVSSKKRRNSLSPVMSAVGGALFLGMTAAAAPGANASTNPSLLTTAGPILLEMRGPQEPRQFASSSERLSGMGTQELRRALGAFLLAETYRNRTGIQLSN